MFEFSFPPCCHFVTSVMSVHLSYCPPAPPRLSWGHPTFFFKKQQHNIDWLSMMLQEQNRNVCLSGSDWTGNKFHDIISKNTLISSSNLIISLTYLYHTHSQLVLLLIISYFEMFPITMKQCLKISRIFVTILQP